MRIPIEVKNEHTAARVWHRRDIDLAIADPVAGADSRQILELIAMMLLEICEKDVRVSVAGARLTVESANGTAVATLPGPFDRLNVRAAAEAVGLTCRV